jgi:hypothetical protein
MGEAMADQDLSYTADIIKAALPYIDTGNKAMVEFMVKAFDLMGSLKAFRSSNNMAACGFEAGKIDWEGLLNGIRPILRDRERKLIDQILNFFNMKRMFDMYNKMMEAMQAMQDVGGFNFGDSPEDAENVAGNFGGMNFDSIFKSFENKDNENFSETSDNLFHSEEAEKGASDNEKEQEPPPLNTGGKMNDRMLEMLKAMVPPEQRATFENLSMLLNTMSYDNNSKPDDNKESNDG